MTETRRGLTGELEAVCVVHQLRPDDGNVGVTAIDKRPVGGAVKLRRFGLYGDVQADRKHHGGEEKAVYAYAAQDAQWWSRELNQDLPAGSLGENLRVSGFDINAARAGERWQVGKHVVLEATHPRIPCATFGRWLEQPGWVRRFIQAGRPGVYFKVIQPGAMAAGDAVVVLSEGVGPTIAEISLERGPAAARPND